MLNKELCSVINLSLIFLRDAFEMPSRCVRNDDALFCNNFYDGKIQQNINFVNLCRSDPRGVSGVTLVTDTIYIFRVK